jgi:UDP-glucuronate 4-epimerase
MQFIEAIEAKLGRQAIKELLPLQPGDVPATFADVTSLEEAVGFRPQTSVQEGIGRFIDWYRSYYQQ